MKEIPLTRGFMAKCSDDDFYELAKYRWYAAVSRKGVYARRGVYTESKQVKHISMAQTVLGDVPKGKQVDHINGDTLDNRRENLRLCTPKENSHNRAVRSTKKSCPYLGAYYRKDLGHWSSYIRVDGEDIFLGFFDTPEDAGMARDAAAAKYHGEFAKLNFPEKLGQPIRYKEHRVKSGERNIYPKKNGRFEVQFRINTNLVTLGTFATLEEAVKARNAFRDREKPECEIGRNPAGNGKEKR